MPATYMKHTHHGATHAYDYGEVERLKKAGWVEAKEPTGAEILAAKRADLIAARKAELAELEAVPVAPADKKPARKKPGPKPKAD